MQEYWKPVPDMEEYFEVSSLGRVRNKRTQNFITGDINSAGYCRVMIQANGISKRYFRHRLVATVFIPNPQNKPFVNHINGDKSDNSVINLEWVTQSENEKHAFKLGLKRTTNKPFKVIYLDGTYKIFNTQKEFGKLIGKNQSYVSDIITNKYFHRIPNVAYIEFIV